MGWDGLIPVMIAKLSLERLKPHLNEFTLNQNQIFIKHQKLFFGNIEFPPLASKAFVGLDAGGAQVALNGGVPFSVIQINDDHCIHRRERCKVSLRHLIAARPLDLVS